MSAYLAMGGYGAFVWPAYAVAIVVLAGLGWSARAVLRRQERELARLDSIEKDRPE